MNITEMFPLCGAKVGKSWRKASAPRMDPGTDICHPAAPKPAFNPKPVGGSSTNQKPFTGVVGPNVLTAPISKFALFTVAAPDVDKNPKNPHAITAKKSGRLAIESNRNLLDWTGCIGSGLRENRTPCAGELHRSQEIGGLRHGADIGGDIIMILRGIRNSFSGMGFAAASTEMQSS